MKLFGALSGALALLASTAGASGSGFPAPLADAVAKAGRACTEAEREKVTLSPESTYWLGRAAVVKVLAHYSQSGRVAEIFEPDTLGAVYLSQVGHTLVEATGTDADSDVASAPLRGFHFILVRDPVPEAWSFPGGFVVVTDGLLMRAASEEHLAGILAHELAHLRRRHVEAVWRDALCRQRGVAKDPAMQTELLVGLALKAVTQTGFGATLEGEADAEATRNLQQAGYAPLGLGDFLDRSARDASLGVFKRHPPPTERHKAMAALVNDPKEAAHAAGEATRTVRFFRAMVEGGLRPDWRPILDFYRR